MDITKIKMATCFLLSEEEAVKVVAQAPDGGYGWVCSLDSLVLLLHSNVLFRR